MKRIVFEIDKAKVYEEVAKTTSYAGAKMADDATAYDRIFTTDEDQIMLERFWSESKNVVSGSLKKVLDEEREEDGVYHLVLDMSSGFDEALCESMERSLFSFFVTSIVSKWYVFTNKKESSDYALLTTSHIDDVLRKAYYKKKPMRPRF